MLPFDLCASTRASLAAWSDGARPAARPALQLHPADGEIPATRELRVIGKGNKERFVPIGAAGLAADCAAGDPPTPRARNSQPTASTRPTRR
ncbi:hypothetical protein [Burkholderia ubonensis]|uniref:hypothetical protein n=1 Tax=Burkholderia ubonensis TaxID=101571 RepID=UPI00142D4E2C